MILTPALMGAASTERSPSARQFSRSTRLSVSVSSQRKSFPLRTHSPENPEPICSRVPVGGASGPELALHTINSGSAATSAIAAPEARVILCARAAINCTPPPGFASTTAGVPARLAGVV